MEDKPIRMDLSKPELVSTNELSWLKSPAAGVERKPLERERAESGHTTSIVRYAPESHFPAHVHTGGEEFLVLAGTFSDEHGDYPQGTYVRNPPMTKHAPYTKQGCMIFVKLCQYQTHDTNRSVQQILQGEWVEDAETNIRKNLLHKFNQETICIEHWGSGAKTIANRRENGEEIFVIEGSFNDEKHHYKQGTWIRLPAGSSIPARWSDTGCLLYVKRGHL